MTLEGAGWDHVAWRVDAADGAAWIVRAASLDEPGDTDVGDVRREVAVMQLVRRHLGDLVADAVVLDASTGCMAHRRVPGVPLQDLVATGAIGARDVHRLAAEIGRLIADDRGDRPGRGERADPRRRRRRRRVARRAAGGAGRDRVAAGTRRSGRRRAVHRLARRRPRRRRTSWCWRTTTSVPSTCSSIRPRWRSPGSSTGPTPPSPTRRPSSGGCCGTSARRTSTPSSAVSTCRRRAGRRWRRSGVVVRPLPRRRGPRLRGAPAPRPRRRRAGQPARPLRRPDRLCVTAYVVDDVCGDTERLTTVPRCRTTRSAPPGPPTSTPSSTC